MINVEQIEFRFEEGEVVAPVSLLFKRFIYEMLRDCLRFKSEAIYDMVVRNLKIIIKENSLFTKTPLEFQKEVDDLLELDIATVYEAIHNEPFIPVMIPSTSVKTKPQLKLVK